ncbi:MAG: phasin family protein [Chloroflexaceae bacterium]|nr:phasin family protein [Chloroflexaceae bacterium]
MSEEIEVNVRQIEEQPKNESAAQVLEVLRRLVLAGVGALALSRDEAESFIKRLVDRGEIAQKDGEKLLHETMEKFGKQAPKVELPKMEMPKFSAGNINEQIENNLEQFLNRLNIPSKRDIDELSAKIAQLAARVEELRRTQTAPNGKSKAAPAPAVVQE